MSVERLFSPGSPGADDEADCHLPIAGEPLVAEILEDVPKHLQDWIRHGGLDAFAGDEARRGGDGEMLLRDDAGIPSTETRDAIELDALEAAGGVDQVSARDHGVSAGRGGEHHLGEERGAK